MDKRQREELAGFLAAAFVGGVPFVILSAVLSVLSHFTLRDDTARWLAQLVSGSGRPMFDSGLIAKGPAQTIEEELASGWSAIYVLAAAERLEAAKEITQAREAELRYFASHLEAENRRMRAAAGVDGTAHLFAGEDHLLSWRTVIDEKTTLECRWANGRNFDALEMPSIGWPGAVHVKCRCTAGPAVPGAPRIPPA